MAHVPPNLPPASSAPFPDRQRRLRDNGGMDTPDASGRPAPGRCRITLNGAPHELAAGTTIAGLLEERGMAGRRVAVEVNQAIVPRGAHGRHRLQDGDRVEIVHALGGG